MKHKLNFTMLILALLTFCSLVLAQNNEKLEKQVERNGNPEWDGKIQGLFTNSLAFMHLTGEKDYERLASGVLESLNRKWTKGQFKLSRRPYIQTVEKEKYLTIRAEGRDGVRTVFFPVSSEGPQGIIIGTNGSICHPSGGCNECVPTVDKTACRCPEDALTSPIVKCDYGGGVQIAPDLTVFANMAAVDVGTVGASGGPIKFDRQTLIAQVADIIPGGFKITDADIKAIDKEYYSLTSLTNKEGKSYLFISKLENKSGSLGFKAWGFLYHCEGVCGFSVAQCEAKSPYTAPNGQLSCGCNGHCAPKYGIVFKLISIKIAVKIY